MNLWQKIIEVRKAVGTLSKDKKAYNFSYVTGDQILHKIKYKMDELGLILQPSTLAGEWARHDYINTKGKEKIDFLVWGQGSYTWINAEKPEEREVVQFAYYGQQGDDMSQAYGTALTYSERYFLLKYFGIPTDEDDPDNRRQQEVPSKSYKLSEKQINRLYAIGNSKGFNKSDILKAIKSDYKHDRAEDLTKTEYDALCKRLEEYQKLTQ